LRQKKRMQKCFQPWKLVFLKMLIDFGSVRSRTTRCLSYRKLQILVSCTFNIFVTFNQHNFLAGQAFSIIWAIKKYL
jgi:hypothetical protein